MESMAETKQVTDSVILEVSRIVSEMAGIQLGPKQASMVENRLKTRMIRLGISSFSDYLGHLQKHQEDESQALLSLMTTHHTFFFREFTHFEFLLNPGLTRLIERARARGDRKIRVWSAASSRGQEAYSLGMFFSYHLKQMAPDVDFEIVGTDIDPESVNYARNGVYKNEELKQSPVIYLNDNWIRGTGKVQDFSKVKDTLKSKIRFDTANLLSSETFLNTLNGKKFDVIFCRNVFIYFNQDQIKQITQTMTKHLDAEGFLILGVSETLNGLGLPVEGCGSSIYQLPHTALGTDGKVVKRPAAAVVPGMFENRIINVLCVDDSKVIQSLLKRILTKEMGFNIKDVAMNGREAIEKIKTQKFDIVTLDLHMPVLDGLGFLTESKGIDRPPIVILSAINRDDMTVAQSALKEGASDYVEKPTLENVAQTGNEIRSKLKMTLATLAAGKGVIKPLALAPKPVSTSVSRRKKVLIVDDSRTIRTLLSKIISMDPDLEVVASAEKPSQVEELIKQHKPDVITLDIHMPEMDGVTLLKKYYPKFPIPTVMISSISKEEGTQVLEALESGAVDYIQKPEMGNLASASQQICERIKNAASAKARKSNGVKRKASISQGVDSRSLVVIGSSTGGTEALRHVFTMLPEKIPPILVVQHIPPVFSMALANRLNELCPFKIKEAAHGDEVLPNQILIAPGAKQMKFKIEKDRMYVEINDEPPLNRHKPSVDYLFNSVAESGLKKVVAVILTGMGNDGAKMMKKLHDQGALTIAQDQESSVVFGMPGEAVKLGAADHVLPIDEIAQKILDCSISFNHNIAEKSA